MTNAMRKRLSVVVAGFAGFWLAFLQPAGGALEQPQQTYASADEAAAALATAARSNDQAALPAIFGPGSEKMLSSGDRYAEQEQLRRFAAAYDEKHTLEPQGDGRMVLEVGNNDWPLPIPIVQADGRWHFDTKAGADEIVNRRIGRNELSAISVVLDYVDAQKDFFQRVKAKTGTGFYAERLISTPGHQDGLYWPAAEGAEPSPFAVVIDRAEQEGYAGAFTGSKPIPYQGYYFRVLKSEGTDSPDGVKSYLKGGKMTEGFALIAWPSSYGSSGIMTFEAGPDGVVFQKDLGADTARIVSSITQFDPDLSWARINITNP